VPNGAEREQRVQDPEPRVIRAAVDGDLDAFDVVVRTFQEPIWRFLCAMVRDPALAEDLTQETFLRAFDRLATFEFRSRLSTWLFTIARNLGIDALRQRDRQGALLARLGPDAAPPPEATLRAEVDAAVGSLSTKLREALLLVEVMGFTCREAGEVLGIAEGTVKSRLYHARARLVAWFDADDGDEQLPGTGPTRRGAGP
jgi:RNA polymerase sigma-70 factor, ECF subfamily